MSCQVVTVTNRIPGPSEPYYRYADFIKSLARFNVAPTVLGMNEMWWGLMTKPRRLRKWLRDGNCKADHLIVSDAYDVMFAAHPDAVAERWGGGDDVMFNAERGLFPRGDLVHAFPECGTPFRFLNSGLFIGKPGNILAMLEGMNLDELRDDEQAKDEFHGAAVGQWVNTNDQGWYQVAFAAHVVPMVLDTKCEVFQALSACSLDEFDIRADGITNKLTGTNPLVVHANGGSKNDILPVILNKWGLA